MKRNVSILGIILAISSFFTFTFLDTMVKIFSQWYNTIDLSLLLRLNSSIILFFILSIRAITKRSLKEFKMQNPYSHLLRGILMIGFTIGFTLSFRLLPLTTAYSIIFMLPIVTALIASVTLKEYIPALVWIAIISGFLGMILVLRPGLAPWNWGYLSAFLAICLESPFFILARRYHSKEFVLTTVFYPQLIAAIALYLIFYQFGNYSMSSINFSKFYGIIIMVILNMLAQIFINLSLKYNDTNISTSMQYSQVIFGGAMGYLFFKEVPSNPLYLLGTAIILLSGYTVSTGHLPFVRRKSSIRNLS